MARIILAFALTTLLYATVCAQSARERRFIREGDTEASVLAKLGKPDYETTVALAPVLKKQIGYFPHEDDAQTLTVITLSGGRVLLVERSIQRDKK